MLYLLTVIAYFIVLDVMRDDLFNEQVHVTVGVLDRLDIVEIIFLVEFSLLCAFLIGSILFL